MWSRYILLVFAAAVVSSSPLAGQEKQKLYLDPINVQIPHISTDKKVKYDYDIVYVRAKRAGDKVHKRFLHRLLLAGHLRGGRGPDVVASRRQGGVARRGRRRFDHRSDGLV